MILMYGAQKSDLFLSVKTIYLVFFWSHGQPVGSSRKLLAPSKLLRLQAFSNLGTSSKDKELIDPSLKGISPEDPRLKPEETEQLHTNFSNVVL